MTNLNRVFNSLLVSNIMSNVNRNCSVIPYSRTCRSDSDDDDNAITLTIPKELDIENCKVSITVLHYFNNCKHMLIYKCHKEIVLG
jgi:hypothetical protein